MKMNRLQWLAGLVLFTSPLAFAGNMKSTVWLHPKKTPSALARVNHHLFRLLRPAQRVALIQAYRDFFTSYEEATKSMHASAEKKSEALARLEKLRRLFALMNDAMADDAPANNADYANDQYGDEDYDCFYAGWPSHAQTVTIDGAQKKLCLTPAKGNASYAAEIAKSSCAPGSLLCNPALFGDGLCVPQGSQAERDSSFRNCSKKFKADGRDLAKLTEQWANDSTGHYQNLLNETTEVVNQICSENPDSFQKGNAMCASLTKRVNAITSQLEKTQVAQTVQPDSAATTRTADATTSNSDATAKKAPAMSSQIDISSGVRCFHAMDSLLEEEFFPSDMVAYPGKSAGRMGLVVFISDKRNAPARALFCNGMTPDHFNAEKARQCPDTNTGEVRYWLDQGLQDGVPFLLSKTAVMPESDAALKAAWHERTQETRDPSPQELDQFRADIKDFLQKRNLVSTDDTRRALNLCSQVPDAPALQQDATRALSLIDQATSGKTPAAPSGDQQPSNSPGEGSAAPAQ